MPNISSEFLQGKKVRFKLRPEFVEYIIANRRMRTGLYRIEDIYFQYREGDKYAYDIDSFSLGDLPMQALSLLGEYVSSLEHYWGVEDDEDYISR